MLAVVFLLLLSRRGCSPADAPDFAAHFGSKTRYEDSAAHRRILLLSPPPELLDDRSCSPMHLTAVVRHGSRYPTAKNIRAIRKLSDLMASSRGAGPEGDGDLDAARWRDVLRRWDMWYTDDMDGQLAAKGREDLRNLASRLAEAFPTLLGEESLRGGGGLRVLTSSKRRCVASAEAFQEGLHRRANVTPVSYRQRVDDGLLRFFDHCRGYVERVEKNSTALREVHKFKDGPEMAALTRKAASKLGLPDGVLTPDLLEAAFYLCSYELAVKSLHSPWCFLFDRDDAKVLEYKCDLKLFWKRAHGHAINLLASCPLFHHIFRTLDKAGRPRRSTEPAPEPASILVGHAETLLPLLGLLGLYKDETPPTADNFRSQQGRQFRSSLLVPYAANVVLVLLDCARGPRLRLLVNETPVRFPGLPDEDAPLYRDVRAAYRHLLDGCDFREACEGGGRPPNTEL